MITYLQKKFTGKRTSFTITKDDVVVYERKTLFSCTKEHIPLVFFSPDVKVTSQKLPAPAKWLFNIMGIAYSAFLIGIVNSKEFADMFNLPAALVFIAATTAAAFIYHRITVKPMLRFYHYNDDELSIPFEFIAHEKHKMILPAPSVTPSAMHALTMTSVIFKSCIKA